jgi:hypothetical protein
MSSLVEQPLAEGSAIGSLLYSADTKVGPSKLGTVHKTTSGYDLYGEFRFDHTKEPPNRHFGKCQ